MRFGVLGPITAWTDAGEEVPIQGVKVRAVLADLLLHVGEAVTADRLVDDVWGESPDSRNPAGTLSSKVSQLRRAFEAAEPGARSLLRSPPPGYELAVDPAAVDAVEFTRLLDEARAASEPGVVVATLTRALGLWRGPAYGEFADAPFARAAAARLEEQRLTAHELLARTRLELGEHAAVADELSELVAAHPWREGLRMAHVLALYRSGRQADALASFEEYRRALLEELGLDPSPEAAALQHAILVQDPSLAPPAPAAPRRAGNLPAPRTALVGRDGDLDDVVALLGGGARLVTLTGPGGVGKTSLALEAARRVADRFADGTWLVELAGVERGAGGGSPAVVAEVVLATLGIRQAAEHRPAVTPAARLSEALAGRRTLLVLDNCEHVVDAAALLVDELLRAAPGVVVLATSRERLAVEGEVVRTVRPLDAPGPDEQRDVEAVRRASGVRLLVERARAAGADVDVEDASAPLLATLVRRLDGLPLALELAATVVPALGLAEVTSRLGDRFWLLGGRRGGPARHRTLAAVIGWSWDLLDDAERCLLRRLAVHADGCTLEAAVAVGAGPELPPAAVPGVLARLVDRSLVVAAHGPAGTRYHLLESVAAYAAERLAEAGEAAEVRGRHLDFHLAQAERAAAGLHGADQELWLGRLDAEGANLRAALDTAVDAGRADAAQRLAAALGWYWALRGRLAEAARALDRSLALGDEGGAVSPAAAWSRVWRAVVAALRGDPAAGTHRAAALAAVPALGDAAAAGRALAVLAYTGLHDGEVEDAGSLLADARARCAAAGDGWGEAVALAGLAALAHARADVEAMTSAIRRADRLFAAAGDGWGRAVVATLRAAAAELAGDLDEAARVLDEGRRAAERLGLWTEVATSLGWSAWIDVERGELDRAREVARRALRLADEQGVRSTRIQAAMALAFAARRAGDLDTAEAHLRRLLDWAGEDPSEADAAYLTTVLAELGRVTARRGAPGPAVELLVRALDLALARDFPRDAAFALLGGALVAAQQARWEDVARLLGAVDRQLADAGVAASPSEQQDIDDLRARSRAALARGSFDELFREGRAAGPATARALLLAAGGGPSGRGGPGPQTWTPGSPATTVHVPAVVTGESGTSVDSATW